MLQALHEWMKNANKLECQKQSKMRWKLRVLFILHQKENPTGNQNKLINKLGTIPPQSIIEITVLLKK